MKKLFLIALLFCAASHTLSAQKWTSVSAGLLPLAPLTAATDRCLHWTIVQATPSDENIESIAFTDSLNGVAAPLCCRWLV